MSAAWQACRAKGKGKQDSQDTRQDGVRVGGGRLLEAWHACNGKGKEESLGLGQGGAQEAGSACLSTHLCKLMWNIAMHSSCTNRQRQLLHYEWLPQLLRHYPVTAVAAHTCTYRTCHSGKSLTAALAEPIQSSTRPNTTAALPATPPASQPQH